MPHFSADSPGSIFSMRGGCVHTMEKPKPRSCVRVNFFVIVNGVRPFWLLADMIGVDSLDDDDLWVDLRRNSLCDAMADVAGVDSLGGGSNSKNRKNRFSSASRWWIAFLLNGIEPLPPIWSFDVFMPRTATASSLLIASSTLVWLFSHVVAIGGAACVRHDRCCNLNVPFISFDWMLFTGNDVHPKNSLRL